MDASYSYQRKVLALDRLSPQDFERLTYWLVRREGYERVEYLGEAGSEQGRDVVACKDGRRVVFQCKRVKRFGLATAKEEIEKLRALAEPEEKPDELVFVVSTPVSADLRAKIRKLWSGAPETCRFWSGAELDERIKRHPEAMREFFRSLEEEAPHWNVPNRNPYFTGREELLEALAARLEATGEVALTQAMTGLGGVAVVRGLARPDEPVEEASERFRRRLSEQDGWLLVLDNVDAPEQVRALLPQTTTGQVIVTTWVRVPGLGRDPLPVDLLPREQAVAFLLERAVRGDDERGAAGELAQALGRLPLALEQAGAYLAHHPVAIAALAHAPVDEQPRRDPPGSGRCVGCAGASRGGAGGSPAGSGRGAPAHAHLDEQPRRDPPGSERCVGCAGASRGGAGGFPGGCWARSTRARPGRCITSAGCSRKATA